MCVYMIHSHGVEMIRVKNVEGKHKRRNRIAFRARGCCIKLNCLSKLQI